MRGYVIEEVGFGSFAFTVSGGSNRFACRL